MSNAFVISSLIYIITLMFIYYSKDYKKNIENKIFSLLLYTNFFGLIVEVLKYVFVDSCRSYPFIAIVLSKMYLVYLLTWLMLFTYYYFIVSFKKRIKLHFNSRDIFKRTVSIFVKIYLVILLVLLILPIDFSINNKIIYSYGPGNIVCIVMTGICIITSVICLLIGHKNIKEENSIPIVFYTIAYPVIIFIQSLYPGVYLTTSLETLVTFMLYFTVINPDIYTISELSNSKKILEESNYEKTEFLKSISHEIRTPLTNIIGFSESLSDRRLSEEASKDVMNIETSAKALLDVVNEILDLSKLDNRGIKVVEKHYDLSGMLNEIAEFSRDVMGKKTVDFRTNFDSLTPKVLLGDYVILRQIILNIIASSISRVKVGYIEFSVSTVVKNNICRVIISVEDTGGTLSKNKLDHIFDSTKEEVNNKNLVEGISTSLAVTKGLVDLLNGKIICQNTYDRGRKISVAIDQKVVDLNIDTLEDVDSDIIDIAGKKVLIVDDNRLNIKVAERLLEKYDLEITSVTSGSQCISRIDAGEVYDLILMDDMMPGISGVETFKKLKDKVGFNTPVIMVTANAITGMKEKYLHEDGFDDYIAKPLAKQEFERAINNVFR